jgi:hypothetical protein
VPLTPEEQAAIDERFEALEDRNAKLERLIKSGKAFTDNPLALATDLDDLGSVKTFLEFDEKAQPDAPFENQLRLYSADSATAGGERLKIIDENGNVFWVALLNSGGLEDLSFTIITGTATITTGNRATAPTFTHSIGWTSTGPAWATIQNDPFSAAEAPVNCEVVSQTADNVRVNVTCAANVAANRVSTVAVLLSGRL